MKNFKVTDKETGKEYWISRAMAVTGIIRAIKIPKRTGESYKSFYLVSKRGDNCPDHQGEWQCTCGYLDFDETRVEAVLREIKEELGLDIREALENNQLENGRPKVFDITELAVIDDPTRDARQNVTTRYLIDVNYDFIKPLLEDGTINTRTDERGGETGEVDEIRLISCNDLDDYEWAFNHKELLEDLGYDADDDV